MSLHGRAHDGAHLLQREGPATEGAYKVLMVEQVPTQLPFDPPSLCDDQCQGSRGGGRLTECG